MDATQNYYLFIVIRKYIEAFTLLYSIINGNDNLIINIILERMFCCTCEALAGVYSTENAYTSVLKAATLLYTRLYNVPSPRPDDIIKIMYCGCG